jgi:hypothetical protein
MGWRCAMTTSLAFDSNQTVNETLTGTSYTVGEYYDRTLPGLPNVTLNMTFGIPTLSIAMGGGWADNEWGYPSTLTVNFPNALQTSVSVTDSHLTFHGNTLFDNDPDNYAFNGTINIDANLVGSGTWNMSFGSTTVDGSVTGGTFNLGVDSNLILDKPDSFNGSIVDTAYGSVTLADLAATSYQQVGGGVLWLFNGSRLVDSLRVTSGPNNPSFGVFQTAGGVVIGGEYNQPGTALPIHSATV